MTETLARPAPHAPLRTRDFALFDAHLHIVDPRFPLVANQGFVPAPFDVDDYARRMAGYRLVGGAVVAGSFQGFRQHWLADALRHLGPSFVGVANLGAGATDAEILTLDALGVRAVRFNLQRGGSENVDALDRLARRVHELAGWHVEIYADAARLAPIAATIAALPAVSVDHLGLTWSGLSLLLRLVERGVRVKASGFGRVDFDVRRALRDLSSANPDAPMFGTDLPSTRAPLPYADQDFALVADALGERQAAKVFSTNALAWYGCRALEDREVLSAPGT